MRTFHRPAPVRADRALPRLERDTPLVALAAARTVVEETARYLDVPLPDACTIHLARRAHIAFARSSSFRRAVLRPGDTGRDRLHMFLRHWLAALLHAEDPALYARLPRDFSAGAELPTPPSPTRDWTNEIRLLTVF